MSNTENYKKEQIIMSGLSVTDVVKTSDYIDKLFSRLSYCFPVTNEILNVFEEIQKPLTDVIKKCNTENCKKEQTIMSCLSITDIVKTSKYINALFAEVKCHSMPMFYNKNDILNYFEDIQKPLVDVIKKCKTDKECPHCRGSLYLSDLPQYEYVCPECEENFFNIEVS